jgi:hypothetical protein
MAYLLVYFIMSYCCGLTTCTYILRSVLSLNRLSCFTCILSFLPSWAHLKNQSNKNNTVHYLPTSTSLFPPLMFKFKSSAPTSTVSLYSFIFPTGHIFLIIRDRKGFFTLSFQNNLYIHTTPFPYS